MGIKILNVKKVKLREPVAVYDMTIEGTYNFVLGNGAVVHNSKDVADSCTGVISGLTQSREIWAIHDIEPTDILQDDLGSMDSDTKVKDHNRR